MSRAGGIIGVVGRSRSGKGVWIKNYFLPSIAGLPILVWSPLEFSRPDDYAGEIGGVIVEEIEDLVAAISRGEKRIVFVPAVLDDAKMERQFDLFCRICERPALKGWCVVVEELTRVTKPQKAPSAWKNLTTAGAHSQEMWLIGVCQRPAQVDKDFFGNCTEIHCYQVSHVGDAKVMSEVLFCGKDEVLSLAQFHYIHRDARTGVIEKGVVSWKKTRKRTK